MELDANLHEIARVPAPRSPTGLAVGRSGEVFVAGELSGDIARYRAGPGGLKPAGALHLPAHRVFADVADRTRRGSSTPWKSTTGATLHADSRSQERDDAPHGDPRAGPHLPTVPCGCCAWPTRCSSTVLLDHAIVAPPRGYRSGVHRWRGETRIVHDGPMWGFDAIAARDGIWVAAGGVEDRPLDRTEGSFGFVDSFVTLYRVGEGVATKRAEINTSALGVVTPKALRLERDAAGHVSLAVASYGSDRFAQLTWDEAALEGRRSSRGAHRRDARRAAGKREPRPLAGRVARHRQSAARCVGARRTGARRRRPGRRTRRPPAGPVDSRLGEALFYTTLMAPWDRSDGRLSRFTCETCHFEGYVDGRTHRTGRGDILATTKPLVGLLGNRPYFSRALDPDMTTMVNNEFRVAGARSGHDSWFSITTRDFPWTRELGLDGDDVTPVALRRALMTYLMAATHRPNPATVGRTEWTDEEREGAEVFRQKCETCHQARLVADEPATRLPVRRLAGADLLGPGPHPCGASSDYAQKTAGVVPYVNENGARVVPLRRLYKKYPYFTNGSAHGIPEVLDRSPDHGGRRIRARREPRFRQPPGHPRQESPGGVPRPSVIGG